MKKIPVRAGTDQPV